MRLLVSLALLAAAAVPAAADHDRCARPYRAVGGSFGRAHAYRCAPRYAYRCAPRYTVCCEVRRRCYRAYGYGWRRRGSCGDVGIAPLWSRLATTFTLDDEDFDRVATISFARVVEPAGPVGGRFLVDCD